MLMLPLLLAALLSSAPRTSQETAVSLALPSDWPVGLHYSLVLVKGREERKDGVVVKSQESSTPIEVEIRAKSADGYVCRWTFGRTPMPLEEKQAAFAETLANVFEGVTFDMKLDESGSVQGFVDEEQAQDQVKRCVDVLTKLFADKGLPSHLMDQILGTLDPKALSASLLREPQLMYLWCGGEFELGKQRKYEDWLPNPFGGDRFPTQASIGLTELRGNEAILDWKQHTDPKRTTSILRASLKAMALKLGKPEPTDGERPKMAFKDRARYVFDIALGLPLSVEWSRTVNTDGDERVDSIRIDARFADPPTAGK